MKAIDDSWSHLTADGVPPGLDTEMQAAVDGVHAAVTARDRDALGQAALNAEFAAMDIELQYTDRAEIDHDRIGSWKRQERFDRAGADPAGVASDRVIISSIKDRPQH